MSAQAVELRIELETLFGGQRISGRRALETFAVINLGLIESLRNGALDANDAICRFYNAANCLFVRRKLRNALCDDVMAHGVQLADLFDALSPSAARRQFALELNAMAKICLRLLRSTNGRRVRRKAG
jgi:hypothetical protein